MFYMVIQNDTIIDVLYGIDYVRTQVVHNILMSCDKEYAEGILSSDTSTIYYCPDLIEENVKGYPSVTLIEIDENRYNQLKETLELNQSIDYKEEDIIENDEVEIPIEEKITLDFIRESKIKEMSNACNKKIIAGFDMELLDGKSHHFDFTLEEQTNFIFLKSSIDAGETTIPYHASNEPCRFFTAEEILKIIETGTYMKTFEITYFNSLREYINSLQTIEEINNVYYGMNIPENYYSEVMTNLLNPSDINKNET